MPAPVLEGVTGKTAGAVSSVTVRHIPGGTDQLYIVVVCLYTNSGSPGTSEVSSVSGGGLTWQLMTGTLAGSGSISQPRAEWWWAYGSPSVFNCTVNLNGTTDRAGAHVAVARISGAANTIPINREYANVNGDQGAYSWGTNNASPTIGATVTNATNLILNQLYPRNLDDDEIIDDADYTDVYDVHNAIGGRASTIHLYTRTNAPTGTDTITHPLVLAKPWMMVVCEIEEGGQFTMPADAGSYALTGTAQNLLKDSLVAAAAGSYALAGSAASLLGGFKMVSDGGTYGVTGTDAGLLASLLLGADPGTYSVTGTDASLLPGYLISADGGAYAITGLDASLLRSALLSAEGGSMAISGTDASLLADRLMSALGGSYALTSQDSSLLAAYAVTADGGIYLLSGTAAGLAQAEAASGGGVDSKPMATTWVWKNW